LSFGESWGLEKVLGGKDWFLYGVEFEQGFGVLNVEIGEEFVVFGLG